MKVSVEQVRHVATLARLGLEEGEAEKLAQELSAILEAMETLRQVDTDKVEPTSHASLERGRWRQDEVRPSLGAQAAVAQAPASSGTSFSVPRVIE